MSVTEFRYKAFISYSHADKAWAEWLLKSLESFHIPRNLVGKKTEIGTIPARLAPIFRDRDELPAAHRLTDRLFEALRASEFLIVLCSPRSAKSKLVNREIVEFKKTHGDGRVLCMIVDGVPFADDPAEECFPEALLHSFLADGSRSGLSAEGLAADIRTDGDGKRMGLLKIVAGMLGVGLNDLVRRDEQRRQRNMLAVASASLVGMTLMGALTYEAIQARDSAAQAQIVAEQHREETEAQLRQNDELLHDLMSIAYERMLEHGNLDTLEAITSRVLESFKGRDMSNLSPVQIFHYTGAILRFGQNLDRQGHSDRARKVFDDVMMLSRRFYDEYPMMEEAIFRYQNNLFFTGYLALRQGRFADAERDYRKRLELNEFALTHSAELYDGGSSHIRQKKMWEVKVADSQMSLAQLLGGPLGRPDEAIPLHLESIDYMLQILEIPSDRYEQRLIQLGSAYQYAAETYMVAGQLQEAEDLYRKRLEIFDGLLDQNSENYRVLRRAMMTKQSLANIAQYRGDILQAFEAYKEASDGLAKLVAKDPANTMWLGDCARGYIDLAETALQLGDTETAQSALETGTAQITEAVARDPSRPKRWLTFYRAKVLEAELRLAQGDKQTAQAKIAEALQALAQENEQYHAMPGTREQFGQTLLLHGQLLAEAGENEQARGQWSQIVDILEKPGASLTLAGKDSLAQAHKLLGNYDRALVLTKQLASYGYEGRQTLGQNETDAR